MDCDSKEVCKCVHLSRFTDNLVQLREKIEELSVEKEEKPQETVVTDGVFTVTVGPAPDTTEPAGATAALFKTPKDVFVPPPRINGGLAIKKNILYLYGGMYEDGDKQLTLNDFYSLGIDL